MEILKSNLKTLRKINNYTQKYVAEKLKMSLTGYASYEQGLSEPNLTALIQLCQLYNVSLDYLLGLENEDFSKNYETPFTNLTIKDKNLIQKYNQLNKRKQNLVDSYIDTMLEFENEEKERKKLYN